MTLEELVRDEIKLLDKKCELLQLRISESPQNSRTELLRIIGRELWSSARRLEKGLNSEQ